VSGEPYFLIKQIAVNDVELWLIRGRRKTRLEKYYQSLMVSGGMGTKMMRNEARKRAKKIQESLDVEVPIVYEPPVRQWDCIGGNGRFRTTAAFYS